MGFLGCGHPILMRACRSGNIYLAMVKKPDSSASEANEMTLLMICAMVRTGPLWRGIGTSSESTMWAPERMRALLTLR